MSEATIEELVGDSGGGIGTGKRRHPEHIGIFEPNRSVRLPHGKRQRRPSPSVGAVTTSPLPGARIDLDGTLNLRDLGGWKTADGSTIRYGYLFRSDRLSDLTSADHDILSGLGSDRTGIRTVIDLRYEAEVDEHPSSLWSTVENHIEIPMAGELANQKSFLDRVYEGEITSMSDEEVGDGYVEMLERHSAGFVDVVQAATSKTPSLFHCTAGKDRTGLSAMLILSTLGVGDDDIVIDFGLSNEYRANVRMAQLAPVFAERGLDVEAFRPALSAPLPAMRHAQAWIAREFGSAERYLLDHGLSAEAVAEMRAGLVEAR